MNTKLFIANKIKVGFNKRNDTYSGKLGYVIGYDGKKWRKETSWEGWRQKNIKPEEYDNVPTEGFVLNKKVGGYDTGWNHRSTKCRVYDPRGFEFEISVENLLFILQECTSHKGKGLDGTFVYSWDGKDLVLLPTSSSDYQESQKFTELQSGKVGVKDLLEGCVYKTKNMTEYIYLGKFNWFEKNYYETEVEVSKNYVFKRLKKEAYHDDYVSFSSLSSIVQRVTDTPVSNYASLLDGFNKSKYSGSLKKIVEEEFEIPKKVSYSHSSKKVLTDAYLPLGQNKYEVYSVYANDVEFDYRNYENIIKNYGLTRKKMLVLNDNGGFDVKTIEAKTYDKISLTEVKKLGLKTLKNNKAKIFF